MPRRIERIVVVGGGTAGWLSAAYLHKMLSSASLRKVSVTLVESEDVNVIGVGEATIPGFVQMMRALDIPEWRLIAEADATYKNAIKFVDWSGRSGADGQAAHFYHQFDPPPGADGFSAMAHWQALKNAGVNVAPLHEATSIGSALCEANRSPRLFNSLPYEAPVPFAYHIDAVKFGKLVRSIAMERGVERIVDHVVNVDLDDEGNIASLRTKSGQTVEGDFFIDCTGYRALLIEGALSEPFISFSDMLRCDRAVTCQVPLGEEAEPPRCYTTATAKSAGWIWEIDIFRRMGTGYVYSTAFVDDDAAEQTLRDHIGAERADGLAFRKIDMRVGRRNDAWVKNCAAIGLSAGFLEPLESTGIQFITLALEMLVDHLAEGDMAVPLRTKFNSLFREAFDEAAEFLLMHYAFNGRRGEPFWDAYREEVLLPSSLVEKLQIWAYKVPSRVDLASKVNIFDGYSYFAIMAGLNALPPFGGNLSAFVDLTKSAALLDQIAQQRALAVRSSPAHADMLQKLRSSA